MDGLMERFLKKIGVEQLSLFEDLTFKSNSYDKAKDLLTTTIYIPTYLTFKQADVLLKAIDNAPFKIALKFQYGTGYSRESIYSLLRDEYLSHDGFELNEMPNVNLENDTITVFFFGRAHKEYFSPVLETWENLLDKLQIPFDLVAKYNYTNEELKKREKLIEEKLPEIQKINEEAVKNMYSSEFTSQRFRGSYNNIELKDAKDDSGYVRIVGKIFHSDLRKSKKGKYFLTCFVYDGTYSIEVIAFENLRNLKADVLESLHEKQPAVEIKGLIQRSNYNGELQLRADYISINEEFSLGDKTEDTYENKRVELHLHTKMSTMDAVSTITAYAKQA